MKELSFDIAIVANHHRKALIVDHLQDIPHFISYTADCDLPIGWEPKPEYSHLVQHMRGHTGAHRCIEGHKSALKMCSKEIVLILEDDAVPNQNNWLDIVAKSIPLLQSHEMISLHGRNADFKVFNKIHFHKDISLYVPKDETSNRYVLGSLAYIIKKKDINKIYNHNYNGLPMDIFIANCFNFCFIDPSPFNHDRSQGSLIDC